MEPIGGEFLSQGAEVNGASKVRGTQNKTDTASHKTEILRELTKSYHDFNAIMSALAASVWALPGGNPLETFSIALIHYSEKRSLERETGQTHTINKFLATPAVEKPEAFETIPLSVDIVLTDRMNDQAIREVIQGDDFQKVTRLEIRDCALSKETWQLLIEKLPPQLAEFSISNTYLDSGEGKKLGIALGKRPLVKFEINLPSDYQYYSDENEKAKALGQKERQQAGLRELWRAFGMTELKNLKNLEITSNLLTG